LTTASEREADLTPVQRILRDLIVVAIGCASVVVALIAARATVQETLNIGGSALEFTGVLCGGLATRLAKPFRDLMRGPLSRWLGRIYFLLDGFGLPIQAIVMLAILDMSLATFLVVTGFGVALAWLALKGAQLLSKATEDGLHDVLEVAGAVFGVGVLMQLVAAVVGAV